LEKTFDIGARLSSIQKAFDRVLTCHDGAPPKLTAADRWRVVVRLFVFALVLAFSFLGVVDSHATDPDGFVAIRAERVESPDDSFGLSPDEELLRLHVRSIRDTREVELSWTVPEDVRLQVVVRMEGGAERTGPEARSRSLGDFTAGQSRQIFFAVRESEARGGIASFTVTGSLEGDREFRESLGITLGRPGVRGIRRAGAIEYPAGDGGGEGR
jgi:hypothetical protein